MGKIYIGDANGIAREVKKIYVGDANGIAREVKQAYVGDQNGVARKIFSGEKWYTFRLTPNGYDYDANELQLYTNQIIDNISGGKRYQGSSGNGVITLLPINYSQYAGKTLKVKSIWNWHGITSYTSIDTTASWDGRYGTYRKVIDRFALQNTGTTTGTSDPYTVSTRPAFRYDQNSYYIDVKDDQYVEVSFCLIS